MKTIFDKIDPKYIECTTGVCEHTSHQMNAATITILVASILFVSVYKYKHLKTLNKQYN